jgi:hypothetical protein
MARGQKSKALTSRAPSSTGHRKGPKSAKPSSQDENIHPKAPPPQARPKPRPKHPNRVHLGTRNGDNEAEAARALVSLHNSSNSTRSSSPPGEDPPTTSDDPDHTPPDEDDFYAEEEHYQAHHQLEEEVDEEDQLADDLEYSDVEVDELDEDVKSDDSCECILPKLMLICMLISSIIQPSIPYSDWLTCSTQIARISRPSRRSLSQCIS